MTLLISSVTSCQDGDAFGPTYLNRKLMTPIFGDLLALSASAVSSSQWFNVRNYGARGDGSTDDTLAIVSAISAAGASSLGWGMVYLPAGVYLTTSIITNPVNYIVSMIGDGPYNSVISGQHNNKVIVNDTANNGYFNLGITGSNWTHANGFRNDNNLGIYQRRQGSLFMNNLRFSSTGSFCILFEPDCGSGTMGCNLLFEPSAETTTAPINASAIGMRGSDTQAIIRQFVNVFAVGTRLFNVDGVNGMLISNGYGHNFQLTQNSAQVYLSNVRLGTSGNSTMIKGQGIEWIGGHCNGHVDIAAACTNVVLNISTVSGVIDNSSVGSCQIQVLTDQGNYNGSYTEAVRFESQQTAVAVRPAFTFSSEKSLGFYRSEASVVAQSYGALSVAGIRSNLTRVIGNYTATVNDQAISVNSTSTCTVTLPQASTVTGQIFDVQRASTGTVVVTATSGSSLNASATTTLATQYQSMTFQSYGSGYLVK